MSKKKQLNIITGFLGSGKSTTIRKFLQNKELSRRTVVVVNEFGANDIDGAVYELERKGQYDLIRLPEGCICCVSVTGFSKALRELAESTEFDRVLIEPSGLARTSEIIDLIDRSFKNQFEVHPPIALMHPKAWGASDSRSRDLIQNQLMTAGVIVINFSDRASARDIDNCKRQIADIVKREIPILVTSQGEIPASYFEMKPAPGVSIKVPDENVRPGKGFRTFSCSWDRSTVFSFEKFGAQLMGLQMVVNLVRFKGFFHTDKGWYRVDFASGEMYCETTDYRNNSCLDVVYLDNGADPIEELQAWQKAFA